MKRPRWAFTPESIFATRLDPLGNLIRSDDVGRCIFGYCRPMHIAKLILRQLALCSVLMMVTGLCSEAGIVLSASGDNGCTQVLTSNSASCSATFNGFDGGPSAPFTATGNAFASGTYGGLHVNADATFDLAGEPLVVNFEGSAAGASVVTTDSFAPSVKTGTLEYELSIDGILDQELVGHCTDCQVSASLTISANGPGGSFSQTPFEFSGQVGAISETAIVDFPYQQSLDITLDLEANVSLIGEIVEPVDWSGSADFENTLTVLGVGVVGQPDAVLNAGSGFQYPALASIPEPSPVLLVLIGLALGGAGTRLARRN